MLQTTNITKDYGSFKLQGINLTLKKGQLFGCIGPNGSGKSTLVKILTGQIKPTTGKTVLQRINVNEEPVRAREHIGIIPEQESPPSFLTVKEYLEFICKIRKISNNRIKHWLDFFEFEHEKDTLIKDLSRGTKQKVVATQAFIHQPTLVFIDEPLINLDPLMQKKFKTYLEDYVKKGNTIFLSTHVLGVAEEVCTDIAILNNGELLLQESMQEIKQQGKTLENFFIETIKK